MKKLSSLRYGIRTLLPLLLMPLMSASVSGAPKVIWDLKREWTDTANPNGAWSLREGSNLIPALESGWQISEGWDEPQPGFAEAATGNQRIPFWYRSNGAETFSPDTLEGDVVVHTTDDFSGTGNGPASVVWTSPFTGTVSVLGGVWMTRDIGRSNEWRLYKNVTLLMNGHIASGDAYNRACPFRFENGASPGTGLSYNIPVATGDEIKLEIVRTSGAGDFVGVDLQIVAGSVWKNGPGANNHIYIPVKAPGGISWQEAEAAAVAAGGHLVSIGSAEENAFVFQLVSGSDYWVFAGAGGQSIGPWLGGLQTPLGTEPSGGWQWSDGRGFGYSKWAAGKPNNPSGRTDRTIYYNPAAGALSDWGDWPDAASAPGYIIEMLPQGGPTTKWTSGPGANGHSYQAVLAPDGITWEEAEAEAVARGGHLASINSADEGAFVFALVNNRPEYWYANSFNCQIGPFIGGYQPDGSPEAGGGWRWTDGSPFTYTNWAGGEPNNSGGLEKYAHLFNCGGPPAAFWNDVSPAVTALGYIVEWGTDPDEPLGPEFADVLYIESQQTNQVYQYRIAPSAPPKLVRSLTAGMNKPSGLALGPEKELFVVQRGDIGNNNASLSRFLNAHDTPAAHGGITAANPPLDHAHGAVFLQDNLYVVDSSHNAVRRFQAGASGSFTEHLPAITTGITGGLARYVTASPSTHELFVSLAGGNNKLLRYLIAEDGTGTPNGEITGNGLQNPHGMVISGWNELFVANLDGNSVSRFTFTSSGAAVPNGTITGNDIASPVGVAFSPWGELFVGNTSGQKISRFTFSSTGAANANGSFPVPTYTGALQFVSASAPEVPLPCVPGTTTSVSEGLIGWWKGDGNALDATGRHPGTEEHGVTYVSGKFGQAFSVGDELLPADSPRVNLGHLPELKGAAAWTISAWIWMPDANPSVGWIGLPVGNITAGSGAPYYGRGLWAFSSPAPNSFHPQFFTFSHTVNYAASVPPFPSETWTHVAGVWRSEDGFHGTYVNGVLTSSGTGTPGEKFPGGSGDLIPAYIGALGFVTGGSTTINNSHPCRFDDIRIYTRALANSEIALIASGGDFNTCTPSDTGHPPLTAGKVPAGIKLSWPSRYTGWSLESGSSLQSWTPVAGTPLLENGSFHVTVPAGEGSYFFRLRRQP